MNYPASRKEDTQEQVTLEIDHRELKEAYTSLLAQDPRLIVKPTNLPAGDVRIGTLLIERKTYHDFLHTLSNERLFIQLEALRTNSARSLLLMEGATQLSPNLRGIEVRITAGWQIPILFAETPHDSCALITSIARQETLASRAPRKARPRRAAERRMSIQHRMLMQIRGVGFAKADALLRHFGSVDVVLAAERRQLLQVPGIGESRVRSIEEALRQDWSLPNPSTAI